MKNQKLTAQTNNEILIPFLKWAGGKRWLTASYSKLLDVKFDRYIEPFLGGGAVFFFLKPQNAILSDVNPDLVNCYQAIKADFSSVEKILRRHQRLHSTSYYYRERATQRRSRFERAAQFLYLNRTCWNGLYRVNLEGTFNVPIGTKDKVLMPSDNFSGVSECLQLVSLYTQDFEDTIDLAGEGDFIFADPPYTVKHNFNGFVKYNESIFSWDDQRRLHASLLRAKNRGAKILLTNADHESVRNLYKGFGRLQKLSRHSVLSGDPNFRGVATELSVFVGGD